MSVRSQILDKLKPNEKELEYIKSLHPLEKQEFEFSSLLTLIMANDIDIAPSKRVYFEDHYDVLIAVGKGATATLTLPKDAVNELTSWLQNIRQKQNKSEGL